MASIMPFHVSCWYFHVFLQDKLWLQIFVWYCQGFDLTKFKFFKLLQSWQAFTFFRKIIILLKRFTLLFLLKKISRKILIIIKNILRFSMYFCKPQKKKRLLTSLKSFASSPTNLCKYSYALKLILQVS